MTVAPTSNELPLWLVVALCVLVGGIFAWMARGWIREWRAYRTGTLIPRGPRPVPPTLRQPWSPWMLLVYAAQAGAVAGGMYFCFWSESAPNRKPEPEAIAIVLLALVCLTAFATAVLTNLADRLTRAFRQVARPSSGRAHGEQARQEELSGRAPATLAEKPQQRVGRHCGNGRLESLPFRSLPRLALPRRTAPNLGPPHATTFTASLQ